MKWLNYHHLLYFKTIVDEGGVASAARKLRLGQPTLSAQLKQLEGELGQALFLREGKRLVLTESGRMAYRYARDIFALGDEMLQVFDSGVVAGKGDLRIAALDNVPKLLLAEMVREAHRLGAENVVLSEGEGASLFESLSRHDVDLVVTDFPPAPSLASENLYAREIIRSEVSVFGASRFASLKGKFPRSLSGQPIILPTGHNRLRGDLLRAFQSLGIKPTVVAETQDTAMQKALASSEVGLVFLPQFAAKEYLAEKNLMKIGVMPGVRSVHWLCAASRRIENPVASRLMFGFEFPMK